MNKSYFVKVPRSLAFLLWLFAFPFTTPSSANIVAEAEKPIFLGRQGKRIDIHAEKLTCDIKKKNVMQPETR